MKHFLLFLAFLIGSSEAMAQSIDFENIAIGQDTFLDGQDGTSLFVSSDFEFPIMYDTASNYWASGFAMSTMRDTSDGSFMNLHSAYTSSLNDDNVHATANLGAGAISFNTPIVFDQNLIWNSLEVTNTTYAYKSMRNGDVFAKKFGGPLGDDPDYFFVRIYGISNLELDSVDFYLADFRFEDNAQDYIIDDWTEVDLSSLPQNATELSFKLFSSDTGAFGVNTPLFFSLDNIQYSLVGGLNIVSENEFEAYSDGSSIQLNDPSKATYVVFDRQGRLLHLFQNHSLSSLSIERKNQILIITRETADGVSVKKIVH